MNLHLVHLARARYRRFLTDDRAAVAVIFCISFFALFIAVALAVDYARLTAAQRRLQGVIDAALLHALRDRSGRDKVALATDLVNARLSPDDNLSDVTYIYDAPTRQLRASATLTMPMTLGSGWNATSSIKVSSVVSSDSEKGRAVDLVFCINNSAGASAVHDVVLNAFKSPYLSSNLEAIVQKYGVPAFDQLNARVILFKDYAGYAVEQAAYYTGTVTSGFSMASPDTLGAASGDPDAIEASSLFFASSAGGPYVWDFVNARPASGGGDPADSGLECVNEALKTNWTALNSIAPNGKVIDIVYPIIVVLPFTAAHPLNFAYSVQNPNYPADMPRDLPTFTAKWNAARASQPNLTLWFMGNPSLAHGIVYGADGSISVPENGFKSLQSWPGFIATQYVTTSAGFLDSIARSLAETYARTRLTE